jgi:hypothetical protein
MAFTSKKSGEAAEIEAEVYCIRGGAGKCK